MHRTSNPQPTPSADLTPADAAIVECLRLLYRRGCQVRELAEQAQPPAQPEQDQAQPSEAHH